MTGNIITLETGTIASFKENGASGVLEYINSDLFVIRLDAGGYLNLSRDDFLKACKDGSITLAAKHQPIETSPLSYPSDEYLAYQRHYGKYFDAVEQLPEGSRFSPDNLQKIVDDFRDPEIKIPPDYLIKSKSSLRRKFKRWKEADKDYGVFVRKYRAPKKPKFSDEVLNLIEEVIYDFFLTLEAPSGNETYARLVEEHDIRKIEGKLPSRSWFHELIKGLDIYEVTLARKGRKAAKKLADRTDGMIHADYPLQYVEVDAVHINIGIVADDGETYLGTLIVYFGIDRCTRCILGYETSIKTKKLGESTQAVLRLIDHIVLPKAHLVHVDHQWVQGGPFHHFINDAGVAFYNDLVAIKLIRIGPHVQIITPTGRPKRKPFIERFNRTFREQLARKLPGYLPTRAVADDYDFILSKTGLFKESEIRKIIEKFICDYYHENPHRGLEGMTPAQAWNEWANPAMQIPADVLAFTDLVGHAQLGVIQGRNGIQTNSGIFYNSAELHALYCELMPNDRSAKNPQVELISDPEDVSYIHVINPETREKITVSCINDRIAPGTSLKEWRQSKTTKSNITTNRIASTDPLLKPGIDRFNAAKQRNKPSRDLPEPTDAAPITEDEFDSMIGQRNQAMPVASEATPSPVVSHPSNENMAEPSIDFEAIPDLGVLNK